MFGVEKIGAFLYLQIEFVVFCVMLMLQLTDDLCNLMIVF